MSTNYYALKFMLDQCLSMVPQHQWVSKLFSYDYVVEFRPSCLNTITDALSHQDDSDGHLSMLSGPPSPSSTTSTLTECQCRPPRPPRFHHSQEGCALACHGWPHSSWAYVFVLATSMVLPMVL